MNQTCFSIWSCNSLSFFEEVAMLAVRKCRALPPAHPRQDRPAISASGCGMPYSWQQQLPFILDCCLDLR